MGDARRRAADSAVDVAKDLGSGGIAAIEREVKRRRDEPETEVARLEHKLGRLRRIRWLSRIIASWQLGRARDRVAAKGAK